MSEAQSAAPAKTPKTSAELKAIVESGYDHIAPRYLAWSGPRPTTTRAGYVQQLIAKLPAGAKVLELGCGAGVPTTQTLVAAGLDVTGVDISAAQVALAREHVPGATFEQADMAALERPAGALDAVMAFYAIFHLPADEQGPMIEKIVGWLKSGGYLLLNMRTEKGDVEYDDWMGKPMFSSGLGVEANREIFKKCEGQLRIIAEEVAVEKVGGFEEHFHWFFAVKE